MYLSTLTVNANNVLDNINSINIVLAFQSIVLKLIQAINVLDARVDIILIQIQNANGYLPTVSKLIPKDFVQNAIQNTI